MGLKTFLVCLAPVYLFKAVSLQWVLRMVSMGRLICFPHLTQLPATILIHLVYI